MSQFSKLRQNYKLPAFIIINICLFIYLVKADYIIFPDSRGYIYNHIIRTPSYPLLLDLFHFIFGWGYLSFVAYFQIILSFIVSFVLANTLRRYFGFGEYIFILLYLILLYPLYSEMNLSNKIIPDSLAYNCFIMIINYFVVYVYERKKSYLIVFLALSVLIITIRPQFVFMYIINMMVIAYHLYRSKNVREVSILILLFLVLVFLASIYQRTYNYIYHGSFSTIPFTGIQLVVSPLYLSGREDLKLFQNYPEEQREFLEKVYSDIEVKKLSSKYRLANIPDAFYYRAVYNEISWGVVAKNYFGSEDLSGITPRQFIDLDKLTISVALKLLPKQYIRFIKLYIANIIVGIGFTGSFLLCFFAATFLILFIKTKSDFSFLFMTIYVTALGNCMLISLVEPVMKRYTFYTDMMLIVSTAVFLYTYVRDSRQNFIQQ